MVLEHFADRGVSIDRENVFNRVYRYELVHGFRRIYVYQSDFTKFAVKVETELSLFAGKMHQSQCKHKTSDVSDCEVEPMALDKLHIKPN